MHVCIMVYVVIHMTSRTARQVIAQRREWHFRVRLVWGRVVAQSSARIGLAKVRPPIFIVFLTTQLEERDGLRLLTVRIGLRMNIRGFFCGEKSNDPLSPDYLPSIFKHLSSPFKRKRARDMERYERLSLTKKRNRAN